MPTTRAQALAATNGAAHIAAFPDPTGPTQNAQSNPTRILESYKGESGLARRALKKSDVPPTFTIDLSLPPAERYVHLVEPYRPQLQSLTSLFDEVVLGTGFQRVEFVKRLAGWFLRRLRSAEQTEELRGIAKAAGVDLYLLIAFNTLLDLFMGCTSGGVRTQGGKMLHFRTLDWGMDALREIIVVLEFVREKGGPVVARSVSYVGFVGVLTGVCPDLSVSLNFRPVHDENNKLGHLKFYGHHLLVLLGLKPSISSILRGFVLKDSSDKRKAGSAALHIDDIAQSFPIVPSTAAYVILCNGSKTTIIEKDRRTARIRSSDAFVVATNHDLGHEGEQAASEAEDIQESELDGLTNRRDHADRPAPPDITGIADLVEESVDRKKCITSNWERACWDYRTAHTREGLSHADAEKVVAVSEENVVEWLLTYPITNECTHFAAVMDPKEGEIRWVRRWRKPYKLRGQ